MIFMGNFEDDLNLWTPVSVMTIIDRGVPINSKCLFTASGRCDSSIEIGRQFSKFEEDTRGQYTDIDHPKTYTPGV